MKKKFAHFYAVSCTLWRSASEKIPSCLFFFLRRRWNPLDRQREEEKVYTHKNSNKLKTVVVRLHSVLVQKASLLVFFRFSCYCCLIMRNNDADKKFIRSTLRTSSLFVSKLLHSSFFFPSVDAVLSHCCHQTLLLLCCYVC